MSKRMSSKQRATLDFIESVVNTCGFEELTIRLLQSKMYHDLSVPFEHVYGTAQGMLYKFRSEIRRLTHEKIREHIMPAIDDIVTVFERVCVNAMEQALAEYLYKLAPGKGGTTDPDEIKGIEDDLETLVSHAGNWPSKTGMRECIDSMCKRVVNSIADSEIYNFGSSLAIIQLEESMKEEAKQLLEMRGESAARGPR